MQKLNWDTFSLTGSDKAYQTLPKILEIWKKHTCTSVTENLNILNIYFFKLAIVQLFLFSKLDFPVCLDKFWWKTSKFTICNTPVVILIKSDFGFL